MVHLATGDALPVQVRPHLQAPIQRFGRAAAIGVRLVNPGQNLGHRGIPQLPFPRLGQTFIVRQQLLLLSVTLGAVAALTFATLGLQDKNSRQDFFDRSLADLRQGLAMLSYYIGGVNGSEILLSEEDRHILAALISSLLTTLILSP
jgi:hypothetical protein